MSGETAAAVGLNRGAFDRLPDALPIPKPPLNTKEGWADFVRSAPPERPILPSGGEWARMPAAEKRRFDANRRRYHDSFGPVLTPTMHLAVKTIGEQTISNLGGLSGARPGSVIDGRANVGKTTILREAGRSLELTLRREYGERMLEGGVAEWHPVVYQCLDARTTVKGLNIAIAHFYGAMLPQRGANTQTLTQTVVEHAQRCCTVLFLIDEIHNLKMGQLSAREVNNHLKHLMNVTSATFVYAGVGCLENGLFNEGYPENQKLLGQTRGRFARFPVEPFEKPGRAGGDEWERLVASFEAALVLRRGHEGMLSGMASYLHQRTGGVIGALSKLVRVGATRAIDTGEERITRRLLDAVKLDLASETGYAGWPRAGRKHEL